MVNIRQKIESRIIKSLTEEANNIAEKARQNASWSRRIPNAISVEEARKNGDRFEAIISRLQF